MFKQLNKEKTRIPRRVFWSAQVKYVPRHTEKSSRIPMPCWMRIKSETPPLFRLPSRMVRSPLQVTAATSAKPLRATNLNAAELQGRQISDLYARTDGLDTKMEALFARMEARTQL